MHRRGNHISAAAEALHTSQPGMSKQIQLLEAELGFEIFQRKRNRVVGLTDPGREVIEIAQRILNDVDNLHTIHEDYNAQRAGQPHDRDDAHLRALRAAARRRTSSSSATRACGWGSSRAIPTQICETVENGRSGPRARHRGDAPVSRASSCCRASRSRAASSRRKATPILRAKNLTLQELAKYPIIAHDRARSGRWKVMDAFHKQGIEPNIIFGAVDADVVQDLRRAGPRRRDPRDRRRRSRSTTAELRARDASHLFESSTTYVSLRANSYLRRYIFDFITARSQPGADTPETCVREAVA